MGNLKEITTCKTGVGGRILLKWALNKYDGKAWSGFICLRTGT
jgi:hypothetical protein